MHTLTVRSENKQVHDDAIDRMTALDKHYENLAKHLSKLGYRVSPRSLVQDTEAATTMFKPTAYKLSGGLTVQPVVMGDDELLREIKQFNEDWEVDYSVKIEGAGGKTVITLS